MPSKWAMVDNSFPTFSDDEKPKQQINKLVDYMFILVEELKYQLENLDAGNWNTAALESLQDDTTADVRQQLAAVAAALKLVTAETASLSSKVSTLEALSGRVMDAEKDIGLLQKEMTESILERSEMREQLGKLQAGYDEMAGVIRATETGAEVGHEGQELHLLGKVYINGKLIE